MPPSANHGAPSGKVATKPLSLGYCLLVRMLTMNAVATKEIIVLQYTSCGRLSAKGNDLAAAPEDRAPEDRAIDIEAVCMDPRLPEMRLLAGALGKWIGITDDVDKTRVKSVEHAQTHSVVPDDIVVNGWICGTEIPRLRVPTMDPTTDQDARARIHYSSASTGLRDSQQPRWKPRWKRIGLASPGDRPPIFRSPPDGRHSGSVRQHGPSARSGASTDANPRLSLLRVPDAVRGTPRNDCRGSGMHCLWRRGAASHAVASRSA